MATNIFHKPKAKPLRRRRTFQTVGRRSLLKFSLTEILIVATLNKQAELV